jgi:hypothetical protein
VADTNELVAAVLRLGVLWVDTFTAKTVGLVVWVGSWNSVCVLSALKAVILRWSVAGLAEFVALSNIGRAVLPSEELVTYADSIRVHVRAVDAVNAVTLVWSNAMSAERSAASDVGLAVRSISVSRSTPAIVALTVAVEVVARGMLDTLNTVAVEWAGTVMLSSNNRALVGALSLVD